MNWHLTSLLLNLASIALILGMAWLMVFKMPKDATDKWWHTTALLLLVAGFGLRVADFLIGLHFMGNF